MVKWIRWFVVCVLLIGACSTDLGTSSSALNLTPTLASFALYAARSVKLGNQDQVSGGDIGVAATTTTSFGPQLVVGNQVHVSQANNLIAPSVALGPQSQVGDLQTNALTNNGAQSLGVVAMYPVAMPTLPLVGPMGISTTDLTIASQAHVTLSPGTYRNLTVGNQALVTLVAGSYSFAQVSLGNQVQVFGSASGVTLLVGGTFATGNEVQINRAGAAGNFTIYVAGNDVSATPGVSIGQQSQLTTLFAAPYCTMSIGSQTQMKGAFAAFDVTLGNQVKVTYQGGLSAPATPPPTQVVPGMTVPVAEASAPILGPVPQTATLTVGLELPLQNVDLLKSTFLSLYDPNSAQYQQFLTPQDFTAQFSSSTLYQELVTWAQSQGLQTTTFANNRVLDVSGTVALLESAFNVAFNYYGYPPSSAYFPQAAQFFAPDRLPTIPASLPPLFNGAGFNSFNIPVGAPPLQPLPSVTVQNGSGPMGLFWGSDFRILYAGGTSLTGAGQTLAVLQFGQDFRDSDVNSYLTLNNTLPSISSTPIQRIQVSGGALSDFGGEATLDVEVSLAMAPGLSNLEVFEAPPQTLMAGDASAQALFNAIVAPPTGASCELSSQCPSGWSCVEPGICQAYPLANQVSCSWSGFDGAGILQALVNMSMIGQSVFISSTDIGAFVSTNPLFDHFNESPLPPPPLNSPSALVGIGGSSCDMGVSNPGPPTCWAAVNLMTVVGGTESISPLGTPLACTTEGVWNNPTAITGELNGQPFGAFNLGPSGGGICPDVTIPAFQPATLMTMGASPPANNGSTAARNIPDVAALADSIFVVVGGKESVSGGTSAAAPVWAGLTALINQQRGTTAGLGILNPHLYAIGQGANYNTDFFDIIGGTNNPNLSDVAHWTAVPGFDLTTGWGSPRAGLFVDLAGSPAPTATFDHVNVTVTTGDDQLRCTSIAQVLLFSPNLTLLDTVTFHKAGDVSLPNNSIQLFPNLSLASSVSLTGATSVAFVQLNLIQTNDSCQLLTTSNNWDVAGLVVQLTGSGIAPFTIFSQPNFSPPLRLMDNGMSTPWSVEFPTVFGCQQTACPSGLPFTTSGGTSCATQSDCPSGTGVCLGSTGMPGSGCCSIPDTLCMSDADCASVNVPTCFGIGGSATVGSCVGTTPP